MVDTYLDTMTRLPSEITRLNEQFDLMAENIGYIIHPSITLPPTPRIADIGTGTGRFLLRLQPTLPNASFEGFDIAPDFYPPQDTLPPNMSLEIQDLKRPFPELMHQQYNMVHVRMLVAAMLPDDWEPAVHNLMRLLKPGGYLQWEECDFAHATMLQGNPSALIENSKHMFDMFRASFGDKFVYGWSTLPGIMRSAGLDPVVSHVMSSDRVPETRARETTNKLALAFTSARMAGKQALELPGNKSLEEVEKVVYEEIESGCYLRYDIHVVCGQKPTASVP
ncbi:S-adenosyl-L-methionine-dependent methyltransferase [Camillea tinctor]|nr:S-adenosyl-L-methionine-dependent methyltransferase [Camillea tinctor]